MRKTPAQMLRDRYRQRARKLVDRTSCEQCGKQPTEGRKGRIEVHHIDGNPLNNDPTNLQALCWDCHWEKHPRPCSPPCTVAGCTKPNEGHGLCVMHLARLKRNGSVSVVRKPAHGTARGNCTACGKPAWARGLCQNHYQMARYKAKKAAP